MTRKSVRFWTPYGGRRFLGLPLKQALKLLVVCCELLDAMPSVYNHRKANLSRRSISFRAAAWNLAKTSPNTGDTPRVSLAALSLAGMEA